MPCLSPLAGFRPPVGSADRRLFIASGKELYRKNNTVLTKGVPISIPCRQCIACRVERSRQWAIRCMHEASLYDDNCFITLTYSDENLPAAGSLVPNDFRDFMYRLRSRIAYICETKKLPRHNIRFYACGEYGDQFARPHYHALIFNFDFYDKTKWRTTDHGHVLYRSKLLEELWPLGTSEVGAVTFDSAAYVARYCVKKVNGDRAAEHYHVVDAEGRSHMRVPEFGRMSLKPGIGDPWLKKFGKEVYDFDFVLVNGVKVKPPKFYDRKYQFSHEAEFEVVRVDRLSLSWKNSRAIRRENSEERLSVKSEIAEARLSTLKRRLS